MAYENSVYEYNENGELCVRVIGASGGGDQHNLGWYATQSALGTAHPTATDGDWAIVGSTDTVWVWDSDTTAWVDSDQKGQVTSVNNQTGAVTVQETLVSGTNIKTVDGNTLLGSGNLELSTYLPFPNGWTTNGTTKALCDDIAADTTAVEGKAYLGEVTLSDLPASMANGEVVVEIMDGTTSANKVIVLTLTSGNTAPYMWKYTYWNGGSDVSGWKTWATSAQGAKADTAVQPGDLATVATTGSYTDLMNTPTIPAAQVNSDWNAVSGVAQILNKPSLAAVATSGSYSDLTGTPTIPTVGDGTITITQGGVTKGTFTTNQSGNTTIDVDAGGGSGLPDQTGQSGKFLTTDGTDASWAAVNALQNTATGTNSLTIDGLSSTSGYAVNIGKNSLSSGLATSVGASSRASDYSVSFGYFANANSYNSVAIGYYSNTIASDAIAIGYGAHGYSNDSVVIGYNAQVSLNTPYGIQIGTGTNSDANTFKVANANGNFEIMDANGNLPAARLASTTGLADGNYRLRLTMTNGVPSLSWVAE